MQNLYRVHFRECGKDFLLLLKFASENGYSYDDILDAAEIIRRRGAKRLSLDQLKVALQASRSKETISPNAESSDEYLEITIGSEDILNQLSSMMGQ